MACKQRGQKFNTESFLSPSFFAFLSSLKYLISSTRFLEKHTGGGVLTLYCFPFFFFFLPSLLKVRCWCSATEGFICPGRQLLEMLPISWWQNLPFCHLPRFAEGNRMACICAWKPCRAAKGWWWGCRMCVLPLTACCFGQLCLGEVWPRALVCPFELQTSWKCCSPESLELWLKGGVLRYSVYVACWVRLQSSQTSVGKIDK